MSIAYTVEMDRMRPADSESGDRELDGRVPRKTVHAARRKEVPCVLSTAQNLKEDGDSGRRERRVVDEEVGAVKVESHVDSHIDTALSSDARLQGRWYEYQTASYASRQTWPVPFSS